MEIKAVSYSNDLKPEILEIHKKYKISSFHKKMKSSLKFCVVAAGEFDMYVAEPRACEWDIAAGHAILDALLEGKLLILIIMKFYMENLNFKNPSLILKSKNIIIMDEQLRIILIIIVSVSIFGLISFCFC